MLRIGRIPFISKSLALMAFKGELASKFAANAVASFTSPTLFRSFHLSDEPSTWYRREQKGLYLNCRSCGTSPPSPPPPPPPSPCLPPLDSTKPQSSKFALLPFPLKQSSLSQKIEVVTYRKDVSSTCLKSTAEACTSKVRRSFTYRRILLNPPVRAQMLGSRGLHGSSILLGKSRSDSSKDCKSVKEICRSKKDICSDTESCKGKDTECYPEKVKCEPEKRVSIDLDEEKQVCPKSCVRGGKCIIAASKKPAKMVYGSTECPPPKLISPRTCPRSSSNEYANDEPVCNEKVAARKLRKDVCVPPPLPGPPNDPVPLCPCPPPPKLHPGPCPCPAYKEELKIKQSPPCPVKDKYPCCLPIYYCPPKEPCVRKLPCDQTKKTKS